MTDHSPDSDTLVIRGLRVAPIASPETEILQGIDLEVGKGEVHAIMGPNGSGKTTLAYALMGHPSYKVTGGQILWKGRDILALSPDKRSRLGMFLAFQYPTAIPGLSVASFIRSALNAKLQGVDKTGDVDPTDPMRGGISMRDFRNKMREKMALLQVDEGFASRYVNEGFSGGEKKRLEMLQMAVLEPEMAILDETDSGLDIDALRIVAEGVNAMLNPNLGVLLITHYQRLLNYITPDRVHVLAQGRIVKSGGKDLALRLEDEGYGPILREAGLAPDVPDEALLVPEGTGGRRARAGGGRPLGGRKRPMAIEADAPASAAFDPHVVRRDFPILEQVINGHKLVYLDSASSSQKPRAVHRSGRHATTASTTRTSTAGSTRSARRRPRSTSDARAKVARFINAPDSHEIVFTRNATEAINLVAYSWGRRNINRGDAIVLTEMEHHANLVPWQILVQERDGDLEFIPITDDGILRLDVFEVLLRLKPKLVAFTHVSNTLGTINPVREMVEMAHAAGALVLVDGAQAVPHVPVDVQDLGADFYAFSGHKMLGPMGSGALWARRELLEAMPPFLAGGEMIREVHLRRSEFNEIPWKFEAGTPAVADAIGLGVAAEYLMGLGMDAVRAHERELVAYALDSCRGPCRRSSSTGRWIRTSAAASSRSTCRVSTRTTSPRSSTDRGSRSGPATTARCRSTSGWIWPRRRELRSTSTRRARTSMRSSRACTTCSGSSGQANSKARWNRGRRRLSRGVVRVATIAFIAGLAILVLLV